MLEQKGGSLPRFVGRQLAGLILVTWCLAASAAKAQDGPPPAPVEVVRVELRSLASQLELVGTAVAERAGNLAAEVEGPIVELPVREGDRVARGAILAVVRTVQLELAISEYEAQLEATRSRLFESRDDLERTRELSAQQVVSERRLVVAEKGAEALERDALRLEVSLARARDMLARASVRAPYAGVVTAVAAELGQWVREGDTVARLVDLSRIEVRVPLPERLARDVAAGDAVSLVIPALRTEPFEGTVRAVVPEAEPSSRTFPLIVDVANPEGAIRSGMSARVSIETATAREGVVVPKDALVASPMGTVVYVALEGRAAARPVTRGVEVEGFVEVTGVDAGELVVVRGNDRLRDGQAIRVLGSTP